MSNKTSATIGAVSVILAAIITSPWVIPEILKHEKSKHFVNIESRQQSIEGSWSGNNIQRTPTGPGRTIELSPNFRLNGNLIEGSSLVRWQSNGRENTIEVVLDGGYINSNHLEINYRAKDSKIVNYGTMFLRLNSSGNLLQGEMIGFGHESESIISGAVHLEKL